jgi:uncharacterized membrane protein YphA (DoxX/SURF4 family)
MTRRRSASGSGFISSALAGQTDAVAAFTRIGAGQWLRYLAASCELAGGIGLAIPRLAGAAATGLVGLMIGATIVNLLVLGPAAAVATLLLGVVCTLIARYRWHQPHSLTAAIARRIRP